MSQPSQPKPSWPSLRVKLSETSKRKAPEIRSLHRSRRSSLRPGSSKNAGAEQRDSSAGARSAGSQGSRQGQMTFSPNRC